MALSPPPPLPTPSSTASSLRKPGVTWKCCEAAAGGCDYVGVNEVTRVQSAKNAHARARSHICWLLRRGRPTSTARDVLRWESKGQRGTDSRATCRRRVARRSAAMPLLLQQEEPA